MRVLVTGAGGNLGRVLAPALVAEGHAPRLFDARPIESEHEVVRGDVRDRGDVRGALQGVDAVVHGAALRVEVAVREAVLERHWPGCTELFAERGLKLDELICGDLLWPPTKAQRLLGYRPRYDFGAFLDALRRDDRAHYPFAELPWWGAEEQGSPRER